MAPSETIVTSKSRVACDGAAAAGGHPRIWMTIGESGEAVCPYCSRRFVLKPDTPPAT